MPTIAENLRNIQSTKLALKASINAKNVGAISDSTPFSAYPSAIDSIGSADIDMSGNIISDIVKIDDYSATTFTLGSCIKSINVPEGITKIAIFTFVNLSLIDSFEISENITSIGNYAFYNCSNLKTVIVRALTPPTLGSYVFSKCHADLKIYVPSNKVSAYQRATNWSVYADKIQAIP